MSLFTAQVCVLIYGVLNHPWKSRVGLPAHKSHSGWGYTAGQSSLPHFAGVSLLPKQELGELRPQDALLVTARILGRNLEIKLTDCLLEQRIY